jgi:hypothetical protein
LQHFLGVLGTDEGNVVGNEVAEAGDNFIAEDIINMGTHGGSPGVNQRGPGDNRSRQRQEITAVTGKGQRGWPSKVYSAGRRGCCLRSTFDRQKVVGVEHLCEELPSPTNALLDRGVMAKSLFPSNSYHKEYSQHKTALKGHVSGSG